MRLVVEIPAHIEYLEYLGQLEALGDACSLLEPPDQETVDMIRETKANGGRVIAVGTTSCRTLEAVATAHNGELVAEDGYTDIFIYPGYSFKVLDGLITNFHLPESTLIMLISAFLGYEKTMHAYEIAVQEKYRFFSFGDAMCILPEKSE